MTADSIIGLSNDSDWRAAVNAVPHGIGHTWQYWYGMHLTSGLEMFLYSFTDGETRIVCPFAERTYEGTTDIVSPPGLSGFTGSGYNPQLHSHWNTMMSQCGYVCAYVGLHPALVDLNWFDGWPVRAYSTAYSLDLTLSLDEIFQRMSENRRRDLQHARSEGVRVWVASPEVRRFFVSHFEESFQRRGAHPDHYLSRASRDFFCTLENFLLVGAGRDQVESATAFGFTPYVADGLYNVSFSPDTSFSTLLIWTAVQELRSRKVPVLNLGGGVRHDDGVARYKRYLGAFERPLFSVKQVFDPIRFAGLCRSAGFNSDDVSGYFPPYREPRRTFDPLSGCAQNL